MLAKVYQPTPANIRRLASALKRGELVAIPTETVYGLAANALNAKACRAIFRAKRRPTNDPLIVHVRDLAQAEQLAEFNPAARLLARHYWPGPLTLVLPKRAGVPAIVTSGGNTVALRMPAHPLARRLLRAAGLPLAAPSANLFGYVSPTDAAHVLDGLGRRIKYVLDGGPCSIGVESTILDLTEPSRPRLLRPGAVTAVELGMILNRRVLARKLRKSSRPDIGRMAAPGMMEQHYSPATLLRLRSSGPPFPLGTAVIFLRKPQAQPPPAVYWLSAHGSLQEIARNLYRVLREVDRAGFREIWLEPLAAEAQGLAAALRDRMQRAAAKR